MWIDMWYGDAVEDCNSLTSGWADLDCVYRGNLYRKGRPVGDYTTRQWGDVEKLYRRMTGGEG